MAEPMILALSCADRPGIVARVTGYLALGGCNIIEAQQFDDLAEGRFARAIRALAPRAVLLCGSEARLDVVGTAVRKLLNGGSVGRVYGYRAAQLVSGRNGIVLLGETPGTATESLLEAVGDVPAAAAQRRPAEA